MAVNTSSISRGFTTLHAHKKVGHLPEKKSIYNVFKNKTLPADMKSRSHKKSRTENHSADSAIHVVGVAGSTCTHVGVPYHTTPHSA